MRKGWMGAVVVVVAVLILAGGGFWYHARQIQARNSAALAAVDQMVNLARRWDDAQKLASSTSRIALAGPISELQSARRALNDITPPACAKPAYEALGNGLDESANMYIQFMGGSGDMSFEMKEKKDKALGFWNEYTGNVRICQERIDKSGDVDKF